MPTLNWIGKDKIVNHHNDVPFRVLNHVYGFTEQGEQKEPTGSGNMIIHGDNLAALKSLLPKYENGIDCIYIDPPYNTGEEKWVYNDNVNDPRIMKWLGEVVGKEEEDFSRHDKWLCMMYPRLVLLRKLLKDDNGVIFISIDDNEVMALKAICNEIFGTANFVGQWNWYKSATPPNLSKKIKKNIEYVLCYEKKKKSGLRYSGIKKSSSSPNGLLNQTNKVATLVFPAGSIETSLSDGIYLAGKYGTKTYDIELLENAEVKDNIFITPVKLKSNFKWSQRNLEEEIEKGTKIFIKTKTFSPSYDKLEYAPEVPPNFINENVDVSTTEEAGKALIRMFGEKKFDYPKPISLIEYLINFCCDEDAIVLDCFAGSGTTGHALLDMNNHYGGNRKFIMVELMDYADSLTAQRIKYTITGYNYEGTETRDLYSVKLNLTNIRRAENLIAEAKAVADAERSNPQYTKVKQPAIKDDCLKVEAEIKIKGQIEGLPGAFDYYELGDCLFDEEGYLNEEIDEEVIREYIFYSETKCRYIKNNTHPYLLGTNDGCAYYFYYEKGETMTLDYDFLRSIKEKSERYVIWADNCLLTDEFMSRNNIVFKKIPRDIRKF